MTLDTRRRKWRWLRHVAWVLAAKVFLIVVGLAIFFGSGLGNPFLQRYIVRRIALATGGKVELKGISVHWLSMRATLKGLTIHGREPAGTEPFFTAEEFQAGLRVDSFWGRRVSLNEVLVKEPRVHIRVEKNGTTNLPSPPHPSKGNKPLRETLFNLHLHGVKIENGWILYNDVKAPVAVEGGDLRFALDAGGAPENPLYLGTVDWQAMHLTARRFMPVTADISAKFTLWRDGFTLEQGMVRAGRSRIDAQAEMSGFTDPQWTFRYRGWLNLLDIRETFRSPLTPAGRVDVRGEGGFTAGQLRGTGEYFGHDITLSYNIFRASGLTSRGSYHMDSHGLEVPDFSAQAFGGEVKGKVTLQFRGLQFRAVTHVQDMRLAPILPDLERHDFPVDELHWDALISADTVETWTAAFSHFEISGQSDWSEPDALAPRHIPVKAYWEFRYRHDLHALNLASAEFDTPSSRVMISGLLAPRNTSLDVKFDTGALEAYNDFIHAVAGDPPGSPEAAQRVSGAVRWEGRITGPGGAPTFTGHARGERVSYGGLSLDSVDGDLTYSPMQLTLARGHLRRAGMTADLECSLALTRWSFLPANAWSADANMEKVPVESLQSLLGWSYPASGLLTGQFRGRGTRKEPAITGLFDLAAAKV